MNELTRTVSINMVIWFNHFLGLDTWKSSESFDLTAHSREEELSIYEAIIGPRVNELQRIIAGLTPMQPGSHPSTKSSFIAASSAVVAWLSATSAAVDVPREQIAVALCASLVSAYRYFAASDTVSSSSPPQPDTSADEVFLAPNPTCPSTPAPPQHSFRKTLFAK